MDKKNENAVKNRFSKPAGPLGGGGWFGAEAASGDF
jgi:hypothetical protein